MHLRSRLLRRTWHIAGPDEAGFVRARWIAALVTAVGAFASFAVRGVPSIALLGVTTLVAMGLLRRLDRSGARLVAGDEDVSTARQAPAIDALLLAQLLLLVAMAMRILSHYG
ncbi:hypothetical protein SAMN04490244_1058 [Tranquillimonas rosea]|uniref:Uncharacterized protein n=1 Tax=Tranquillimonas rosea TaxID=641238 RepID=A0A1H9U470_9RHOB|nr:hypothetical protein [Tranquillimonas rosea]SES03957.1 hypothetical protein SAMN04490244_1058 [Tranquillimonas rosea]